MTTSKGGAPAFEITPEVCKKAESLAAQGLTLEQTAHSLGISYQTLNEKRKQFAEFSEAIALGKAKGIATVTNSLFKKAKEGDVPAIKYYLNNRDNGNWKDRATTEHTGTLKVSDLSESELDSKLLQLEHLLEQSAKT
jgi:hypothetical protein